MQIQENMFMSIGGVGSNQLSKFNSDMCSVHAQSHILIMFERKMTWGLIIYSRATPIMPTEGTKEP